MRFFAAPVGEVKSESKSLVSLKSTDPALQFFSANPDRADIVCLRVCKLMEFSPVDFLPRPPVGCSKDGSVTPPGESGISLVSLLSVATSENWISGLDITWIC